MKSVAILGSTGSIGRSALAVVDAHPTRLKVVSLAAGDNASLLAEQVARYRPDVVAMASSEGIDRLRSACGANSPVVAGTGTAGLVAVAMHPSADIVICASAGTAGLEAVLAAIEADKTIAIANKEVLVMAGALVTAAASRRGVAVLPVDSEHNAIHQCLHERPRAEVRRLILTASGGPFRDYSPEALERAGPDAALQHPTWKMGRKITIDSATLMNKGLELIEAAWLFSQPPEAIKIAVHPPSLVHSMVEFIDGTFKAQLGAPDMRAAIAYAISAPARLPLLACEGVRPWNPLTTPLAFEDYDRSVFRAPDLCREALRLGGGAPAALNAINEELVAQFLAGKRAFLSIGDELARGLEVVAQRQLAGDSLKAIFAADQVGRAWAR